MFSAIYIEEEVAKHKTVLDILNKYSDIPHIFIERYSEVFNRNQQNFRLQKIRPALILARKHKNLVLKTPQGYGIGSEDNYYFSHMLNCVFDCRYCFLQGMYRSAHYVLFINYEDYLESIEQIISNQADKELYFFSGYDCDSLALEPITQFSKIFVPFFKGKSNAWLELRTKSIQIRPLLHQQPLPNVIVAFSFTPQEISHHLEDKVPSVVKRIEAIKKLQKQGWNIGLRFDPIIFHDNYKSTYSKLFEQIFSAINLQLIHSVGLGAFRMPQAYFKNMLKLYPQEPMFHSKLDSNGGMVYYGKQLENEMLEFCKEQLFNYIRKEIFFPYNSY